MTIRGKNLDVGSDARLEIGTEECTIIGDRKSNEIVCETTRSGSAKRSKVTLIVDNAKITSDSIIYQYVPDPTVREMAPTCSLLSGGVRIRVHGTNLNAIQRAVLDVDREHSDLVVSSTPGLCTTGVEDGNTMECSTPAG